MDHTGAALGGCSVPAVVPLLRRETPLPPPLFSPVQPAAASACYPLYRQPQRIHYGDERG
jgi:hypothetical protein